MDDGLELFEDVQDALLGGKFVVVRSGCARAQLEHPRIDILAIDSRHHSLRICSNGSVRCSPLRAVLSGRSSEWCIGRDEAPLGPLADDGCREADLAASLGLSKH